MREDVGVLLDLYVEVEVGELLVHRQEVRHSHEDRRDGRKRQVEDAARLAQEADGVERDEDRAHRGHHEEREAVREDEPGEAEAEVREAARVAQDGFVEAEDDPRREHEHAPFAERRANEEVRGEVAAPRVEEGGGERAEARGREPARAEVRAVGGGGDAGDDEELVGRDDSEAALHQQHGGVQEEVGVEQPRRVAVAGEGLVVDH